MSLEPNYFDEAADVLKAAFAAVEPAEQERLLDEALRLHRLAVAQEQARHERSLSHAVPESTDS